MKINIKKISAMLITTMLVSLVPLCGFAESSFVKFDIKSQANGLLYMDSFNEPATYNKNQFGDNDFLPYINLERANLEAVITSDRDLLSSVTFDGEVIPFDITTKRIDADVTDKEAIVLQPSKTRSYEIEIPDGIYSEIYVALSSMILSSGNPVMNVDLNYTEGAETVTKTIYGSSTEAADVEDAVQISGSRIEMLPWQNLQGSYYVNTKHYVYKIASDTGKVLENIGFSVSDGAIAIVGMTGKLDIDATKVYVENILASGNDAVVENIVLLNDMINTLISAGVDRSTIENIDALDNVKIPVGKMYVNVDIKSQANGLIYMDSPADSHLYLRTELTSTDFLAADGATSETWEAMLTADRARFSSVEIDGKAVPFSPSPRRNGTNVNEKEAVVLRAISGVDTYTVDIPDGCYEELYFVGMSTYKTEATPTVEFEILYDNGEKETVIQPIYGISSSVEVPENAVLIPNGTRVEMLWWSAANDNYTLPSKYFAYKIPTDSAKLVKSVKFKVNENATAIPALTGLLDGDATIAYLEERFADISGMSGMEMIAYNDVLNLLKNNGVDTGKIVGADEFVQTFANLFYVTEYKFSSDLLKWYAEIKFSKPADESCFENNIVVTTGDEKIPFDTEPLYDGEECIGLMLSAKHNINFKSSVNVKLTEELLSADLTKIAAEWDASYVPEQLMEISSFTVTVTDGKNIGANAVVKCKDISEGKPYALFMGVYSKDNVLLDYCVRKGISDKTDVSADVNFQALEKGTYSVKCMLMDSYSTMGLMDKVKEESVKIDE